MSNVHWRMVPGILVPLSHIIVNLNSGLTQAQLYNMRVACRQGSALRPSIDRAGGSFVAVPTSLVQNVNQAKFLLGE